MALKFVEYKTRKGRNGEHFEIFGSIPKVHFTGYGNDLVAMRLHSTHKLEAVENDFNILNGALNYDLYEAYYSRQDEDYPTKVLYIAIEREV